MEECDVVPWFSTNEWMAVYKLIFSKEVTKLEDGYERLRCWKARCNRLPAGIECTLIIVEAILVETRMKGVLNNHLIIKSVYALAITRFLNHAASFDKEKVSASLYKIAGSLNIPEWIVNLRHEAAHGAELPSLEVLRAGVLLALDWLHSAYWTKGLPLKSITSTIEFKTRELKTRLGILVEVYQELYTQKMKGIHLVKNIKSSNLLNAMEEIISINDDLGPFENQIDKNYLLNEEMPVTINDFSAVLIRKLLHILNAAQKENYDMNEIMDHFLEVSYFLPIEGVASIFYADKDSQCKYQISYHMRNMWKNLLRYAIQKAGALPILLKKLVDLRTFDDFRQNWAAFWVREISLAIRKANLIRNEFVNERVTNENVHQLHLEHQHISHEEQLKIMKKLRNCCSEYIEISNSITLSPNHLPDVKHLIEDILHHPRRNSTIYIEELLDIYVNPLSDIKKKKLVKALNIYLRDHEPDSSFKTTKIFDLNDVHALIKTKEPADESSRSMQHPFSGYILEASSLLTSTPSSQQSKSLSISGSLPDDSYDWERIAVGTLPWQENTDMLMEEEEVEYTCTSED